MLQHIAGNCSDSQCKSCCADDYCRGSYYLLFRRQCGFNYRCHRRKLSMEQRRDSDSRCYCFFLYSDSDRLLYSDGNGNRMFQHFSSYISYSNFKRNSTYGHSKRPYNYLFGR
jgi:hypothetical protein